jgi:hypothetical protein
LAFLRAKRASRCARPYQGRDTMTHGKENHRHALAMENDILCTKYLLEGLHDMLAEDMPATATVARHALQHAESLHHQWIELADIAASSKSAIWLRTLSRSSGSAISSGVSPTRLRRGATGTPALLRRAIAKRERPLAPSGSPRSASRRAGGFFRLPPRADDWTAGQNLCVRTTTGDLCEACVLGLAAWPDRVGQTDPRSGARLFGPCAIELARQKLP